MFFILILINFNLSLDMCDEGEAVHQQIAQIRSSWPYDWIVPLLQFEHDGDKRLLDFRKHTTVAKIRTKLHELQTKMVSDED